MLIVWILGHQSKFFPFEIKSPQIDCRMTSLHRSEANTFRTSSSPIMAYHAVRRQGDPIVGRKGMGGKTGVAKIERGFDNQETKVKTIYRYVRLAVLLRKK